MTISTQATGTPQSGWHAEIVNGYSSDSDNDSISSDITPSPISKRPRLHDELALSPRAASVSNENRQRLSKITAPTQRHKLPDEIYHQIRCVDKVIQHLHTKGSTPPIALMIDRLHQTGDIQQVPNGAQLRHELSIHGRKSDKSEDTGELMARSDLASYREQYANLSNVAKTREGALHTYYELLKNQAAHGVKYVEFRTGLPGKLDPEDYLRCCVLGCQEAKHSLAQQEKEIDYGIIILINRGGDNTLNPETQIRNNVQNGIDLAKTAIRLRQAGFPVVGIDLAGDEREHSVSNYKPAFDLIHDYNNDNTPPNKRLGITIHSGETDISMEYDGHHLSGYESVEKSVSLGWGESTPLRIGHGVRIVEHPDVAEAFKQYQQDPSCAKDPDFRAALFKKAPLLKTLFDRQICLETCPKSNFQTGAVSSYAAHPAFFFSDLGLAVTVNTDNEVISKTDPTNEFVKLYRSQPGFKEADTIEAQRQHLEKFKLFMHTCFANGVKSAFIFDELLRQKLQHRVEALKPNQAKTTLSQAAAPLSQSIQTKAS